MKNAVKPNIRANGALRGNHFFELKNQKLALITIEFYNDELRASSDKTENSIGKRYGAVRAFDTFSNNFHGLFSTIRVHVAPTLRPRCGTPMVKSLIR